MESQFHWLGLVVLCTAVVALSACDPGSDSGDGIDPGIVEIPIAFVKRPIPVDDMGTGTFGVDRTDNVEVTASKDVALIGIGGAVVTRTVHSRVGVTVSDYRSSR